ncbi:hypothetical protein M2360_000890 [Rhizobium sp. SG_E_25_P2]|uniref:hypothetical protein n=1 Tax=Rhizobium sp. SG_E_25_P2 TaxID=2879942 RepID=UPI0024762F44|nr:hypothetical protein [Rhizobium sp. SG_E_25_P2]MDH6265500.1 hypothetical protein [Rhizobium sp. SG_E_25_P2]
MISRTRPGYQCRRNRDGTVAHYWSPKRAIKGAPAVLRTVRLPNDLTDEQISVECQRRTMELRAEMRGAAVPIPFDGTIAALIERFRRDPTSALHSVKHSTRIRDYEPSLRVLEKNIGERLIDVLVASDFKRWYEKWKKKGHRRAAGAIKLLRIILSYGAGERLKHCASARAILSDLRFDQPEPRLVAMTYEQCRAIVLKSAELQCPSIGFVEALKFESALRRIDVIGEWTPDPDGGPFRWRGLTVGDLGKGLVLKIRTSKTKAAVARDLTSMPLVTEALKAYTLPEIGPLVIDEDHGKPYWENRYTEKFRKVRDAAGVPDNVWSMDARAGAISETVEATGSLEAGRNMASHTSIKMTARYSRGDGLAESRKITKARIKSRQ